MLVLISNFSLNSQRLLDLCVGSMFRIRTACRLPHIWPNWLSIWKRGALLLPRNFKRSTQSEYILYVLACQQCNTVFYYVFLSFLDAIGTGIMFAWFPITYATILLPSGRSSRGSAISRAPPIRFVVFSLHSREYDGHLIDIVCYFLSQYPKSLLNGLYPVKGVRDLTTGFDSRRPDLKAQLPTSSSSQMITFYFENGLEATIRTSGTEPKIKYYTELRAPPTTRQSNFFFFPISFYHG